MAIKNSSDASDSSIVEFFEWLGSTRHALVGEVVASLRIDLTLPTATQHWYLEARNGAIAVSRRRGRADAVARVDKRVFEQLVRGEANAMTAALRGEMVIRGDTRMLIMLDRLLASPAESGAPQ